jgi:quinol monooxygenase YgiN
MIIVEGWLKMADGELDRFQDAAITMMAETHKEEGCITYCFSRTMADPNIMRLAEIWTDQEALDAHMASPHMAAFQAAIAGAEITGASVKAYEADNPRTLMGED